MTLDILFFRRLFRTNKLLWAASWTFHAALLLSALRHLRYFVYPVPPAIVYLQAAGTYAGYILPFSLAVILFIRVTGNHDRYVSAYNYFLAVFLVMASVSGLLMKLVYRTNIVDVKAFTLGIATFSAAALPDSMLFAIHFMLALVLLPALPFLLITVPFITVEARLRDEGLSMVLHEK